MWLKYLKNKKIIILGYGIEGKSVYEFIKYYYPNLEIAIADQEDGSDYLDKQKGYDLAIKSPGIHKSKVTIPYTTATNIFFANVKGMTIGVTGSKGKSTTSSLIYAILKQAGNNVYLVGNITHKLDKIGSPMLSEFLNSSPVGGGVNDVWICELSSFQLDDILYSPHISVITSFFPEHMDYHGSIDNYFTAKKNIIKFAKPTDYFVYNPRFEKLRQLVKETKAQGIPYIALSGKREALSFSPSFRFPLSALPLLGEHNMDNIKAAVTVAKLLKISDDTIITAIKHFKPLPHRLEKVGTFRGITFYDDAIATTPEATIHAIKTLKNIGTIFLGGQDRGFNFSELAKVIMEYNITNLVLFPNTGRLISNYLLPFRGNKKYNILETSDMKKAVAFAYKHTPKNTICLLSAASPSFSVWKNFEEKGNLFKKFVKAYNI